MKDLIDRQTQKALLHYGDTATQEFYRRLRARELSTTRCLGCGETAFPPRSFCPACHGRKVEWVTLPRRATLYAFTRQERSLRFANPDVIGLVEIAGLGRILSRIDGRFEDLAIGMELELDFVEISPELVLHQFRPAGPLP